MNSSALDRRRWIVSQVGKGHDTIEEDQATPGPQPLISNRVSRLRGPVFVCRVYLDEADGVSGTSEGKEDLQAENHPCVVNSLFGRYSWDDFILG